jgi:hypothetical protein
VIARRVGARARPNRWLGNRARRWYIAGMRRKISVEVGDQVKTALAAGIGQREIARNMDVPEGTVLAHAKRHGWTREIQNAKALSTRGDTSTAVTPLEAVTATIVIYRPHGEHCRKDNTARSSNGARRNPRPR